MNKFLTNTTIICWDYSHDTGMTDIDVSIIPPQWGFETNPLYVLFQILATKAAFNVHFTDSYFTDGKVQQSKIL